jgi:hypothetical protein
MNILKSIGAVLAGVLVNIVLATGTDAILIQSGIAPPFSEGTWPSRLLLAALIYRTLYGIVGGYFTATAAPANPMKHVIILGVLGTIAAVAGVVANLATPGLWYPIGLVVTSFPACWIGGKIWMGSKKTK